MTETYSAEVATYRGLGNIHKLLLRWRASIYKLIMYELFCYIMVYYIINFTYRFYLVKDPVMKDNFEFVVRYCNEFAKHIPVTYVLGFYVGLVVYRWWTQFLTIPWPDSSACLINACIRGNDERGILYRRTMVRYLLISFIISMRIVGSQAKKKYPTMDHVVEAGIMTAEEKALYDKKARSIPYLVYWIPVCWTINLLNKAFEEERIIDTVAIDKLIKFICDFRSGCGDCTQFDWIPIPISYVQLVTICVNAYLITKLIAMQIVDDPNSIDVYVPLYTFLEYVFFMSWLKVAAALLNPFGEDDDDFEINWMIERDFKIGSMISEEMHAVHPLLIKDKFWKERFVKLPYTKGTLKFKKPPPLSASAYIDSEEDPKFYALEQLYEPNIELYKPWEMPGDKIFSFDDQEVTSVTTFKSKTAKSRRLSIKRRRKTPAASYWTEHPIKPKEDVEKYLIRSKDTYSGLKREIKKKEELKKDPSKLMNELRKEPGSP